MAGGQPSGHLLRSVAAILAGIVAGIVLSLGTDALLRATGILPALDEPVSDALLFLATVYRTVYGAVGSYVTARLAPSRPMMHALVLGILGVIANLAGAIAMWNHPVAIDHHWYPIALTVLALPSAWVGGRFGTLQPDARTGC
jgi:hypothetical protein